MANLLSLNGANNLSPTCLSYGLVTPVPFSVIGKYDGAVVSVPQISDLDKSRTKQQHDPLSHFPTNTDVIYMPKTRQKGLGQNGSHEDCKQSQ